MSIEINCKLCGSKSFVRKGKIRSDRKIRASKVLECTSCSFVYLNDDTHISKLHYKQSLMHDVPLSLEEWRSQTKFDDIRRLRMLEGEITGVNILEVGCGNASFLKLAKPLAKSIAGVEPETKNHSTFLSEKLNVFSGIKEYRDYSQDKLGLNIDAILAFHVIEHIQDPINFLTELLNLVNINGKVFIETPNSNDALIKLYDSADFQDYTYWDNHLSLFNTKSIEFMLGKFQGIIFKSIPIQRYGLANHLYWLSHGKPGGHFKWHFLDDDLMNTQYRENLFKLGMNDTLFYEITKIDPISVENLA